MHKVKEFACVLKLENVWCTFKSNFELSHSFFSLHRRRLLVDCIVCVCASTKMAHGDEPD